MPSYGYSGQLITSNADGTLRWSNPLPICSNASSTVDALSLLTSYVNSFKGIKTSGTGISVTSDLQDITITNTSPASSIALTSKGAG